MLLHSSQRALQYVENNQEKQIIFKKLILMAVSRGL